MKLVKVILLLIIFLPISASAYTKAVVDITNMSISDVMSKITMLEIDGKVKRVGGNKFVRG